MLLSPVTCVLPPSPCHHLDVIAPITDTHSPAALQIAFQAIKEITEIGCVITRTYNNYTTFNDHTTKRPLKRRPHEYPPTVLY